MPMKIDETTLYSSSAYMPGITNANFKMSLDLCFVKQLELCVCVFVCVLHFEMQLVLCAFLIKL